MTTYASHHGYPPVEITAEKRMQALLACNPEKLPLIDSLLFGSPQEPDAPPCPPVTISRAAALLGKSRSTLHRWINNKTIAVVEIPGGHPLVPWTEIKRLTGGVS